MPKGSPRSCAPAGTVRCRSRASTALEIWEQVLGREHPDVAQGLNNLAELYRVQGRYAEAEPLYQRAIAILEKALPPDHPHRIGVRENYAHLLDQLGRHTEAAELRVPAQAIR
jgi:tetratricopeptide (TPR) repeat protein